MSDVNINISGIPVGSQFSTCIMELLEVLHKTENSTDETTWRFEESCDYDPMFLMAIETYRRSLDREINVESVSANNNVHEFILSGKENDIETSNLKFLQIKHSLCPKLISFNSVRSITDVIQTELQNSIMHSIASSGKSFNKSYLSFLLGELTDNIKEHSEASKCHIGYCYMPSPDNSLYLCIADNGKTIHGSYLSSHRKDYAEQIGNDVAKAIKYSTQGLSTKNRPDAESRGYGISTNINIISNEFHGGFFILSGNAMFLNLNEAEPYIQLPEGLYWDGTLFLLKIPVRPLDMETLLTYLNH